MQARLAYISFFSMWGREIGDNKMKREITAIFGAVMLFTVLTASGTTSAATYYDVWTDDTSYLAGENVKINYMWTGPDIYYLGTPFLYVMDAEQELVALHQIPNPGPTGATITWNWDQKDNIEVLGPPPLLVEPGEGEQVDAGTYSVGILQMIQLHQIGDLPERIYYHIHAPETRINIKEYATPEDIEDYIENAPDDAFGPGGKSALTGKLGAVENMIANGDYEGAIDKLYNDILPFIDKKVTDPEVKDDLYTMVYSLIDYLEGLI